MSQFSAGLNRLRKSTSTPSEIFDKYTFDITLNGPKRLSVVKSTGFGDFTALSCTTPTKRIATDEKTLWGPVYNIPYAKVFGGDFELTYLYQQDFHEFITKWTNQVIFGQDRAAYYDDIIGSIEIEYRSRNEQSVTKYILKDVFPISINGIELDMASTNSYQTGSVSFSFRDFDLKINGEII
jgi:hypothetical protein